MGAGEEAGLRRIADGLDAALERADGAAVRVLLETTAGQGSSLGHRFEHLAQIIAWSADPSRLGVCLDTCHVVAAGYEIRTAAGYEETLRQVDAILGLERLRVFHFNDCKRGLGDRVDRHAHIGQGTLGLEPFRLIVNDPRFAGLPGILETPKSPDLHEDRENLAVLRGLRGGEER